MEIAMGCCIQDRGAGLRYHFYSFERQRVYRVIHPENLLESPIFLAEFRNTRLDRKVDHPDDLRTGA